MRRNGSNSSLKMKVEDQYPKQKQTKNEYQAWMQSVFDNPLQTELLRHPFLISNEAASSQKSAQKFGQLKEKVDELVSERSQRKYGKNNENSEKERRFNKNPHEEESSRKRNQDRNSKDSMNSDDIRSEDEYKKKIDSKNEKRCDSNKRRGLSSHSQKIKPEEQPPELSKSLSNSSFSSASSSSSMSYDEEMILEQVRCCEGEDDFRAFIELKEWKYTMKMDCDYQKMYEQLKKKSLLLMHIAQRYLGSRQESETKLKENERMLSDQKSEIQRHKDISNALSIQLEDSMRKFNSLEDKYESLQERHMKDNSNSSLDLLILKEKDPQRINIPALIDLEKRTQATLIEIAHKKTEFIHHLSTHPEALQKPFCIICQEKHIDCLLQPCNHACTCYQCAQSLQICPMDRLPLINIKKIYLN